jgi:general secretion pathway protein A
LDEAWRELAKSWSVSAMAPGDPCKVLQGEHLQCFRRTLSLAEIRELGRPGILTLDRDTGAPRYVLLTALDRESATLVAGGASQKVAIAALAGRWQGDFATLWREPPGYDRKSTGGAGETRAWMSPHLPTAPTFTAQLRAFQLSHGLAADGQPGPMTFMQINRAAGVDEPRLRTAS